ncbi:MAG TPA: GNAT family N-acetyltransferase [Ktedonobacteraceae bacterium]|nr:GNAT family N-acetyltransferase [Ktedonobacteraceae bacterium]
MNSDLQTYLREAACRGREVERVGPFLATFTPSSNNPFLNYAIPDDGADPSAEQIEGLADLFKRRGLLPRLEFLPGAAPLVEGALQARSFTVEARMPLMTCLPEALRDLPVPPGIELVQPTSDQELFAMLVAQNEAYGSDAPPSEADLQRRRSSLAAGGIALLARARDTGEPVGGGLCDVPIRGVTELTSVGVRTAFRRQGIAGAMTSWLTRKAFAQGIQNVFLMAAGENEARIYARVGFARVAEVVGMSF